MDETQKNNPFRAAQMKMDDFKSLMVFSKNFVNRKSTTEKENLSFRKLVGFALQILIPLRYLYVTHLNRMKHGKCGTLVEKQQSWMQFH